ncbi:UNVERIFIED_CONTAM: hypothetical protein RMT77_015839 [Armadillidium vulgare]
MYKNYKKKCCDPLKRHKKPILISLVPITPFIEEKFNLTKNNFICSNCLYNHCTKKKLESHEKQKLEDQKEHSNDNLYYNQNIPSSRSPFKDNNNVTFQGSNQTPSNNTFSNEVSKSCNSNSSVCPHYISFIEEKARTYKLEKEVSHLKESFNILKEESSLQEKEISRLKEKIEILEKIKQEFPHNNSNNEENIRPMVDSKNILSHSYGPLHEVKTEVFEEEVMY